MRIAQQLVSIIMPNYNGVKYIEGSVKSILSQSYLNWELIIIDDCSTDDSLLVIRKLFVDKRITIIEQPSNMGVAVARNKGIEMAKGKYIAFIDSDDQWLEKKLERQIDFMIKNKAGFSYTSYTMISAAGQKITEIIAQEKIMYNDLLITCNIGCSTVIYDVDIIGKKFFSADHIPAREDYMLWLYIIKKFPNTMLGLNESLMLYRKHDKGASFNKITMVSKIWEIYRKYEKLNFFLASYYIIRYSYSGLVKHYFNRQAAC